MLFVSLGKKKKKDNNTALFLITNRNRVRKMSKKKSIFKDFILLLFDFRNDTFREMQRIILKIKIFR